MREHKVREWGLPLGLEFSQRSLPTPHSHVEYDCLAIKPWAELAQVSKGWGCSPLLVFEITGDL